VGANWDEQWAGDMEKNHMKKPKPDLPAKGITKLRAQPGMSSAGKYPDVKKFAGPQGTFPINTMERARNAMARSHFAADPAAIRKKVLSAYPSLKKGSKFSPTGQSKKKG
jgi:hypothetical protein